MSRISVRPFIGITGMTGHSPARMSLLLNRIKEAILAYGTRKKDTELFRIFM